MAKEKATEATHVVKSEFRDFHNFDQVWQIGDDVSHFDKDRLAKAVENGHVTDVSAEAEAKKAEEPIND